MHVLLNVSKHEACPFIMLYDFNSYYFRLDDAECDYRIIYKHVYIYAKYIFSSHFGAAAKAHRINHVYMKSLALIEAFCVCVGCLWSLVLMSRFVTP